MRERGGACTVIVRHWLVFRCAPRTDWGGAHLTAPLLRQRPLPEGLLVLRRGGAAPSLGLLPEKETGRIGAPWGGGCAAVACGRGAEAEAPSRAAAPHSHQLQRTTREEDDLINGTLYRATRCCPCGVSFQAVLARLPDLASTESTTCKQAPAHRPWPT